MNILALDPSILHLGWAYMHCHFTIGSAVSTIVILDSGTIITPEEYKDVNLVKRIYFNLEMLNSLDLDVDNVIIEQPENWGAYKSMASSRSGSLLKLELLTGAIVGYTLALLEDPTAVVLVPVSKWKGQLPKHVTQKRMEKKYNCKFGTNDESDAVGIGDWYLSQQSKENNKDERSTL